MNYIPHKTNNPTPSNLAKQAGFTLVEIAIVLVIIGLLLGGVLKGTALIENSKVKKAASEFSAISAAYNGYVDRYNAMPGDDAGAVAARGAAWTNVASDDAGDRVLDAAIADTFLDAGADDGTETAENYLFWSHLRSAGFIKGSGDSLPTNPFGGVIGVTSGLVYVNLTGIKICMNSVSGKAAISLDTQMDDGNGATGSMRGSTDSAPVATTGVAYSEDSTYIICLQI